MGNQQPNGGINMRLYNKDSFEKLLKQKFPNNDITVLSFTTTNGPITYKCNSCGREYSKSRANHLYENKTLCQKCYTARESKIRDWIFEFIEKSSQFSFAEKWHGATSERLVLLCHKCNRTFSKSPGNIYKKEEYTICPYCGSNGAPTPIEDFLGQLTEQERKEYTFSQYRGMNVPVKIRHNCGLVYTQKPANFLKSRGCPHCSGSMSVGEKSIERFLIQNNIGYEKQKHFPDLGKFSYDFYLPELKVLIEYQGQQHYEPVEHFGGQKKFEFQQYSDNLKREYARQNGYQLLEIPYYHLYKINAYLEPLKVQRLSAEE